MLKKIVSFILLFSSLALVGCNKEKVNNQHEYSMVEEVLGTIISGKITGENSKEALEEAFARVREIEGIMSVKREDSEITYVNNNAFNNEVEISEELYYVIEKALYYAHLTNGAFDISIGNLIDIWGIGTDSPSVPKDEDLEKLRGLKGYKNIVLNKENRSIVFLDKNLKLDLGAIAKGYAADEMKRILLEDFNVQSGILNLGGNIITIERKNVDLLWNVGVTDPFDTKNIILSFQVEDKTVVTSGNYERYFEIDNIRYHHIINAHTGYPADEGIVSSTIISNSSIDADALSTSCYILGKDKSMELLENLEGIEGIFIMDTGEIHATKGIVDKYKVINNEK